MTVNVPIGLKLADAEKLYILATYRELNCNQSKTARVLDIERNTLRTKLKLYGLLK